MNRKYTAFTKEFKLETIRLASQPDTVISQPDRANARPVSLNVSLQSEFYFTIEARLMNLKKHGLSVGIERVDNNIFLSLKAIGRLTHEDYELITPMIDSALSEVKMPKVNVLIDGTEMEGWEPRAAWDDFKIGLKHGSEFEKIAIYGNKNWQEIVAKVGSWFISGEVRYFENYDRAFSWVNK